jgi:hypothetical protein
VTEFGKTEMETILYKIGGADNADSDGEEFKKAKDRKRDNGPDVMTAQTPPPGYLRSTWYLFTADMVFFQPQSAGNLSNPLFPMAIRSAPHG